MKVSIEQWTFVGGVANIFRKDLKRLIWKTQFNYYSAGKFISKINQMLWTLQFPPTYPVLSYIGKLVPSNFLLYFQLMKVINKQQSGEHNNFSDKFFNFNKEQ